MIRTFFLCLALLTTGLQARPDKPNVILILTDDLGWQDVGFMGSKYFETPTLDKLAEQSVVFENAFMYPTCSPSRAAILTGKQSFRTDCYTVPVLERGKSVDNIYSRWTVESKHPVFSQPLRKAGYKLIHLGKWHIVGPDPLAESDYPYSKKLTQPKSGDLSWLEAHQSEEIQQFYPLGRGFHENVGGTWWGDPARGYDKGYGAPSGGYIAPFKNPFITDKEDDEWLTDRLTSDAIDFIKRHKDKPFFVNLHYYSPHRPSVATSEAEVKHFLKKPADRITGQGSGKKREMAVYATMVKSIDSNIKRLIDYLDESGLRENTVIVFTSDNGFNGLQSVNKTLRGAKGSIYDGGLRVPALVNWSGEVDASRESTLVQGLDLFPTFLELAGVDDFEGELDGESWVTMLKGESMDDRPLFWHIASTYKDPPCSIIRRGKWKLIQFLKQGNIELYDIEADQKESENLAKSHPEKALQMLKELVDWRKENQVPLPESSGLEY